MHVIDLFSRPGRKSSGGSRVDMMVLHKDLIFFSENLILPLETIFSSTKTHLLLFS